MVEFAYQPFLVVSGCMPLCLRFVTSIAVSLSYARHLFAKPLPAHIGRLGGSKRGPTSVDVRRKKNVDNQYARATLQRLAPTQVDMSVADSASAMSFPSSHGQF
jgi:hypothetical protein